MQPPSTTDWITAIASCIGALGALAAAIQIYFVVRQLRVQQLQFTMQLFTADTTMRARWEAQQALERVIGRWQGDPITPDEVQLIFADSECERKVRAYLSILDTISAAGLAEGLDNDAAIDHYSFALLGAFVFYNNWIERHRKDGQALFYSQIEHLLLRWMPRIRQKREIARDNPTMIRFSKIQGDPHTYRNTKFLQWDA